MTELQRSRPSLVKISLPYFPYPHETFSLVGQERCDRVGNHGPRRENKRLGKWRLRSSWPVVGQSWGYPKILLKPLLEHIGHQAAHAAVGWIQRLIDIK